MGAAFVAIGARFVAIGASFPAIGAAFARIGAAFMAIGAAFACIGAAFASIADSSLYRRGFRRHRSRIHCYWLSLLALSAEPSPPIGCAFSVCQLTPLPRSADPYPLVS
jgi:hypothetical protein